VFVLVWGTFPADAAFVTAGLVDGSRRWDAAVGYSAAKRQVVEAAGMSGGVPGTHSKVVAVQMVAPIRIVVAKPGLDGHDRGAKVVARALRDAGYEVIYTGLHQTPEQIVETAIQEDADVIGLSVLSGAHMTLFKKVIALLDERDARDIVVFGGGIIPEGDIPLLQETGVAKVFTPGATTTEIVAWVRDNVTDAAGVEA